MPGLKFSVLDAAKPVLYCGAVRDSENVLKRLAETQTYGAISTVCTCT